jgi:dienelactone hydrolase
MIIGSVFAFHHTALSASIEDQYAKKGAYATSNEKIKGFRIYYPKNMVGDHPIITWGNGTGAPTLVYHPLLNHLASWGFVVIASDSAMTQSGKEMIEGIDYLIEQNANTSSKFYGMLNVKRIGSTGHSQGGGGAINTATDPRVTCTAPLAPSPGNVGKVNGPILLMAGEMDLIVSPFLIYINTYIFASKPTIFGIISGKDHFVFLGDAGETRGYLTAWFMHHLQGDNYAAQAFIGECEICNHDKWKVRMKNIP